jgi:hypothetical protein
VRAWRSTKAENATVIIDLAPMNFPVFDKVLNDMEAIAGAVVCRNG